MIDIFRELLFWFFDLPKRYIFMIFIIAVALVIAYYVFDFWFSEPWFTWAKLTKEIKSIHPTVIDAGGIIKKEYTDNDAIIEWFQQFVNDTANLGELKNYSETDLINYKRAYRMIHWAADTTVDTNERCIRITCIYKSKLMHQLHNRIQIAITKLSG